MILAIDVGNTQIKTAVFEQNTLIEKEFTPFLNWKKTIEKTLEKYSKINIMVVASVGKLDISDFLSFNSIAKIEFITRQSKFPFKNNYKTPLTLGIDRMILASGATLMFANSNRLVIDAGTCITYDFIDSNNNFLGGAISPGIRLRYQSLHNYTSKLPLLEKEIPNNIIGNSTDQSIHSGIINGVCAEIDCFIDTHKSNNENFIIILTGGDADFLAKRLKNTIFANSNFLLESLNQTFQFNQK